jgi:hypothetical protein
MNKEQIKKLEIRGVELFALISLVVIIAYLIIKN